MKHFLSSTWRAVALGSIFIAVSTAQTAELADQAVGRVRNYNQQLNGITGQRLRTLLAERATAFSDLVALDPAKALSVALPQETLDRLRTGAPGINLETRGEWEGVAGKLIADDFEHGTSRTRWRMTISGDSTVELFFAGDAPQSGTAIRVRGVRINGRVAVAEVLRPEAASSPTCLTTGPQKIAVLMVTTPGNPTFPSGFSAATLQEAFFGNVLDTDNTKSLNGYWKELSYGQTSATGQVFGPFALPTDYICGTNSDQSDALAAAAIAAADSTVDFTQFNRIAIVFPKSACGFGGLSSIGCQSVSSPSKGPLTMSETWLPTVNFAVPPVTVYTHELGHALGLDHSSTEDYSTIPLGALNLAGTTVEYGDPFSVMGNTYTCSVGNNYHGGHYAAQHKSTILHWLPLASGYQEVMSSGTFSVSPLEQSSGVRALRVRRDALTNSWLWIEYRQKLGDVDSGLNCLATNVFNGALIHYEDPALDGLHTYQLDFNPVFTPNNFSSNPALAPGQTWSDPNSPLTLHVNSADSSGLSVSAQYDSPCATLQASASTFPSSGGSGSITVTAPAGCSWTASTGATWLLLTGASSGSGNGTVPFTVTGSGGSQRRGFITVQRQSLPFIQTGTNGLTVVSATPNSGSGLAATFTFVVSAAAGANTLTSTFFGITDGSSAAGSTFSECIVEVIPPFAYLKPDNSTTWNGITLGSGSLSNSQCTLSGTGSSAVKSGTQMTVTLNLSFQASWAGSHSIIASTNSTSGTTGNIRLGAWTVGTASSLTSTSTTVNSSTNPSTYGQNVTLTANVLPAAATGSITFKDGSTTLGNPVTISGGAATFLASGLTGGPHNFTASYSGDSSYAASTSSTISQTVNTASTTTAITSSPNPSSLGQSVTFTSTVSPSTATGTVTFKDGLTSLGTTNLNGGVATLPTTTLTAGGHSVFAIYNGDTNYAGSSSSTETQTVNTSTTGVTLSSSQNPSTFGQNVTFTATVSPATATGSVTFKDGAATLGTASIISSTATFSTASLSTASHSITAVYGGDTNNGGSTSAILTQTVNSAGTGVTLSSSANPSTFGQNVLFTATVSPSTATGTVTFKDGAATLGTANISSGTATFSTTSLSTTSHSITAVYGGDTNNAGSTSSVLTQTVNSAGTGVTLSSSANPSTFGQSVLFTATVSPSTATGTITFKDGAATVSTANLSSGTATYSTTILSTNSHSITAVYSGDSNNAGSTSPAVNQTVNPIVTSATLSSSLNPSTSGQSVLFTATVSPSTATGTVTFKDGAATLGTAIVTNGSAGYSSSALSAITHSITAVYNGDTNDASSTSAAVTQAVNTAGSGVTLGSSVNPSAFGQSVLFTAAVSPASATGTITFKDVATTLGTASLNGGSANFSTATLTPGIHFIVAVYSGDANNAASSSAVLTEAVNGGPTSTFLSSSLNPSIAGQAVTFTANVSPSTATGAITFRDGASSLALSNISGGVATFTTLGLAAGSHAISAVYSGDANNAGSTSATVVQVVNSIATYSITGTVTFGGAPLGNVSMTLSPGGSILTSSAGNFSFSGLAPGVSYTVTPSFSGYTFSPASQTFNSLSSNQTANFTATSTTGTIAVTGRVTTSSGGLSSVTIDVNGTQTLSTLTDSSGNYTLNLTANGTYVLSAARAGFSFSGPTTLSNLSSSQTANFSGIPIAGLQFFPVTPCRVVDTRNGTGKSGVFGPPTMLAGEQRSFPIPTGSCGIPANASAYSLNFTVVPKGYLGVLTTWPTGQAEPVVSTLNSYTGAVVANAAIVPAGTNGAISVHVTDPTEVLFDINGYFAPPPASGYFFYPVSPCRVADTRNGAGKSGLFGPPTLGTNGVRAFPVPSSGCNLPASAAAYSLNFTVLPQGYLGYLSTWPTGQSEPVVSTLNSYSGNLVANAAIVPAGTGGQINVHVTDPADVLFDANGYFGTQTGNGLQFYPVTPCRVADTRSGAGKTGPFGPPAMAAGEQRSFPVPSSTCGIPTTASAYSLNVTVIPKGYLGFLTTWPAGQAEPVVSTLNSYQGQVVANAAIVPAGAEGAISIHVTDVTDVLFDINGYFAP